MNFYEKLLQVQTKLKVGKTKHNSFGNYNYRSCEDILEAVKPLLKEVNATITIDDSIVQVGDRYYTRAIAYFHDCDDPDKFVAADAYAREADEKRGMDPAQVSGSSSSYARKYAISGLLLIDDAKDPDTDEFQKESDAKTDKGAKVTKISSKKKEEVDASDLDKYVTAEQIKTLEMLLEKADVSAEKFCGIYGLTIMSELPSAQYEDAVSKLEVAVKAKKAKEKAEKGE